MTITNKYPATCGRCNQAIPVGARVSWIKGRGVRHLECCGVSCPTCGGSMPTYYAKKGYQCDACANAEERACGTESHYGRPCDEMPDPSYYGY